MRPDGFTLHAATRAGAVDPGGAGGAATLRAASSGHQERLELVEGVEGG